MTIDEWIAFEESNPWIRHELVGGNVHAMTGGSKNHNIMAGNIYSACREAAVEQGCAVYINDVKVVVDDQGFYPDVMVTCADDQHVSDVFDTSPCLLVEVLSPSTGRFDKTGKLEAYLSIAALDAYLVAEPEIVRIEVHQRVDGEWKHSVAGPGDQISLTCPRVSLNVDDLYQRIELRDH